MTELATLEALGFTREEIAERVIDRITSEILYSSSDDGDGYSHRVESGFKRELVGIVTSRINEAVVKIADEKITPIIGDLVSGHTLQATNSWGEKVGQPVTFTEYLVQRADAYMTEQVDYNGKPKGTDGFSWTGRGTRVAYMIDKHLHYHVESAMKTALANANASITKGLNETVRHAISNLKVEVKTEVKTK